MNKKSEVFDEFSEFVERHSPARFVRRVRQYFAVSVFRYKFVHFDDPFVGHGGRSCPWEPSTL